MPKNIVLFIDGTWDKPGANSTNVRRLFEDSVHDSGPNPCQVTYYLPGVGTDIARAESGDPLGVSGSEDFLHYRAPRFYRFPLLRLLWRRMFGGMSGLGTARRIAEAYLYLCDNYQRGDKIFIFGFSRGAFAARSLAGFAATVGVLLRHKDWPLIGRAWDLYEAGLGRRQDLQALLRESGVSIAPAVVAENPLLVHFLGVWDTVGAMGWPNTKARFKADFTQFKQIDVPPNVFVARHAMALHELRPTFRLMMWENPNRHNDLLQVWFPGGHGDVGGGYPPHESGFAQCALSWMTEEARNKGLLTRRHPFRRNHRRELRFHLSSIWLYMPHPKKREQLDWIVNPVNHTRFQHARNVHISWGRFWPLRCVPGHRLAWLFERVLTSVDLATVTMRQIR